MRSLIVALMLALSPANITDHCGNAARFQVSVAGIGGARCCPRFSRTWTLDRYRTVYREIGKFGCDDWMTVTLAQLDEDGDEAQLVFSAPPDSEAKAIYECKSWDCTTGGTFTLRGAAKCSGFPATVTVSRI